MTSLVFPSLIDITNVVETVLNLLYQAHTLKRNQLVALDFYPN